MQGPVLDTAKFSARYKSGEGASSLAAYRKNLIREKPPFYTPTTPPITTQVVSDVLLCKYNPASPSN